MHAGKKAGKEEEGKNGVNASSSSACTFNAKVKILASRLRNT